MASDSRKNIPHRWFVVGSGEIDSILWGNHDHVDVRGQWVSIVVTLNNLGNIQINLTRFENAVASFEEALDIRRKLAAARPDVYLSNVAGTLNNLGNVQINLTRFEDAVASFEEALDIYEEIESQFGSAQLMERIHLYRNFANLVLQEYLKLGWPDYGRARELLQNASRLGRGLRGMFRDPRERIRVQQEQLGLYDQRVDVCLKCAERYNDPSAYDEALEAAEAARSRALLDALAQQLLPEEAPTELKQRFQRLQRDLRRAQRRLHQELETLQALAANENRVGEHASGDASSGSDPLDSPTENESDNRVILAQPRRVRDALTLSQLLAQQSNYANRIEMIVREIQGQTGPFRDLVNQLRTYDPQFQSDVPVDSFRIADRAMLFADTKRTFYVHFQPSQGHYLAMILTADRLIPVHISDWTTELVKRATTWLLHDQMRNNDKEMTAVLKHSLPEILNSLQQGVQSSLLPALVKAGLQPEDRLVLVPDLLLSFLPLHATAATESQCLGGTLRIGYYAKSFHPAAVPQAGTSNPHTSVCR